MVGASAAPIGEEHPVFYRFHSESGDPAKPPSENFILLVPGSAAPLVPVDLPNGLRGVAREQAARLQLSDVTGLSATMIEARPCDLSGQSDWDRMLMADAAALADWRHSGAEYGATCQAILPDYLALPAAPDVWVIEADAEITRARLSVQDGFAAENALASVMIDRALAAGKTPKAILLIGSGAAEAYRDRFAALNIPIMDSPAAAKEHGLSVPGYLRHNELAHDLSQNPERALSDMNRRIRPLVLALICALLAALVWAVSTQLQIRELQVAERSTRDATTAVLRARLLPSGPILDAQTQVTTVLTAAQTATAAAEETPGPMVLLRRAASVLMAGNAELRAVDFSPLGGFSVQVQLPSFAVLDQLVEALQADGFRVAIAESGARDGNGIDAKLDISTNGAVQ